MKLSRQFYVSPCHESRLEVEQATEENRPGAVNSNVTHSRSHDLEALGKCFAPISALCSAGHIQTSSVTKIPNNSGPIGQTGRRVMISVGNAERAAPELSLCHGHPNQIPTYTYLSGHWCPPRSCTHRSRWGCWESGACCLVCSGWAASVGSGGHRVRGGRAGASGLAVAAGDGGDPLHLP